MGLAERPELTIRELDSSRPIDVAHVQILVHTSDSCVGDYRGETEMTSVGCWQ
jgi:hypothetical protein